MTGHATNFRTSGGEVPVESSRQGLSYPALPVGCPGLRFGSMFTVDTCFGFPKSWDWTTTNFDARNLDGFSELPPTFVCQEGEGLRPERFNRMLGQSRLCIPAAFSTASFCSPEAALGPRCSDANRNNIQTRGTRHRSSFIDDQKVGY